MEQSGGFLADEVEAAAVVDVVDVVPGDPLCPVLLLQGQTSPHEIKCSPSRFGLSAPASVGTEVLVLLTQTSFTADLFSRLGLV